MFYLASKSPRRRELLESAGLVFSILAPDVDERTYDRESPERAVGRLAQQKADAGVALLYDKELPRHPVMAADTVVVVDHQALGKPCSAGDAFAMLQRLSGRRHRVLTTVVLSDGSGSRHRTSESFVTMKRLTRLEIQRYWETGEPRDKAGAYAIQGIGSGFVSRVDGSYSGVVGLPMYEARELLATVGIDWL